MIWNKKARGARVDPEELLTMARETTEKVESQKEHVNFINSWLENRYMQNGLGDDFEWTIKPKKIQGETA